MPGTIDAENGGVKKIASAAIFRGVLRPTLAAVDQQRRAGDARPQRSDFPASHIVGRPDADIVVELPTVGTVLVLVHTVLREVARLFGGQVRVLLLHAVQRVLDRGVAPRQPTV